MKIFRTYLKNERDSEFGKRYKYLECFMNYFFDTELPEILSVHYQKEKENEKLEKEIVQTEPGVGIIQEGINTTSKKDSKVNINIANKEKLATLPGIGEGTAEKIIEYRSKTGKFKTIDEKKKIPGIGESKFKSLKDKITIK